MKKADVFKILLATGFLFVFSSAAAHEITEERLQSEIGQARAMQSQIENECKADPRACSCDAIPCEEILQSEDPSAQEAYGYCVEGKSSCEQKRQAAIAEIDATKTRIENECRQNIDKCSCEEIQNSEGKKQCELSVISAKYQAEKEKSEKIRQCQNDLDNCFCSDITNESGRAECESAVGKARELKEKIKAACEQDPINCDCAEIENEQGRAQCEQAKQQGLNEAQNQVKEALSKCFKDVDKCVCSSLGLPEESYVSFCEIQKSYGISCRDEGLNCDKLEDVEIYPPGMPAWLGKFFAKDYSQYIEKEKSKGAKKAAGIIQQCLESPRECRCDETPTYARAFCARNRDLQIKCEDGDYDACILLDETPNLPEGVPQFSYSLLDKLVGSLRSAKKNLVISNAARKVGGMILKCMDDSSKCDCSLAPSGPIKSFCEHKKEMVNLCREKKQYDACFKLDEEEIYPVQTPEIIQGYIEKI